MRYLLTLVVLLVVTGCSTKYVFEDDIADLIPQDVALEYLVSEEVMGYSEPHWMCVFSRAGVHMFAGFTPYDELEFTVRELPLMPQDGYQVYLGVKGGLASCVPYWGPDDNNQLSKIATALVSLGVENEN